MADDLPDSKESTEQYSSVRLQVETIAASSIDGSFIKAFNATDRVASGIATRSRTSSGAVVWLTPIVSRDMASVLTRLLALDAVHGRLYLCRFNQSLHVKGFEIT